LGDAFYARPFVREAIRRFGDVYVQTSWPWVFSDLAVKPTKRVGGLAVQAHHGELVSAEVWHPEPPTAKRIPLRYRWNHLKAHSAIRDMEERSRIGLGRVNVRLGHPPLPPSPLAGEYAVIRPPAARLDYPGPAREPDPAYLAEAADALHARGLKVVTVGAWLPGLEEPSGAVYADVRYENGELPLPDLCALVAGASVVVSGPCWLLPFALAANVPMVLIAGGCGTRNSPRALVDHRIDTGLITWLKPDRYCMCGRRLHNCPKEISDFTEKLGAALDASLGVAA
jgi:hypothetical protein